MLSLSLSFSLKNANLVVLGLTTGSLIDFGRNIDRVNHQHCVGRAIEIDAHILLPSLLPEVCLGVRQGLFDNRCLDIDQALLEQRTADQRKVFTSGDQNL